MAGLGFVLMMRDRALRCILLLRNSNGYSLHVPSPLESLTLLHSTAPKPCKMGDSMVGAKGPKNWLALSGATLLLLHDAAILQ